MLALRYLNCFYVTYAPKGGDFLEKEASKREEKRSIKEWENVQLKMGKEVSKRGEKRTVKEGKEVSKRGKRGQ